MACCPVGLTLEREVSEEAVDTDDAGGWLLDVPSRLCKIHMILSRAKLWKEALVMNIVLRCSGSFCIPTFASCGGHRAVVVGG